jgi:hypothetical protein
MNRALIAFVYSITAALPAHANGGKHGGVFATGQTTVVNGGVGPVSGTPASIPGKAVGGTEGPKIDFKAETADPKAIADQLTQLILGGYTEAPVAAAKNTEKEMRAMVAAWVDKAVKDDAKRAKLGAMVYLLKQGDGDGRKKALFDALKSWKGEPMPNEPKFAKYNGGKASKWSDDFLTFATDRSQLIFSQTRTQGEVVGDVIRREDKPGIPTPAAGGTVLPGNPSPTSFDRFFKNGGTDPLNVFQKGDTYSRTIVLKIATVRDGDYLSEELRIYDITDRGDVVMQTFPIGNRPDSRTFVLDDRPGVKPVQYKLEMKPDSTGAVAITFGRPDSKKGQGLIETSVDDLRRRLSLQAQNDGTEMDIGGQKYYVLGQSGDTVDKLFFPASIKDNQGDPDTSKLRPTNMATVSFLDAKGRQVNITDKKPDIGVIAGQPYHLEWVAQPDSTKAGYPGKFKVAEGKGDLYQPPAPPKVDSKEGGKEGGKEGEKEGGKGGNGGNGADGSDPAQYEKMIVEQGYYKLNTDASAGAPEGKFRIYSITPQGEEWLKSQRDPEKAFARRHVLVIPSANRVLNVPFSSNFYQAKTFTAKTMRVLDGKFLVSESDAGFLYMDINKVYPDRKTEEDLEGFVQVGEVGLNGGEFSKLSVTEYGVLDDAMRVAGFTDEQRKVAMANALKVLGEAKAYTLSGTKAVLTATMEGVSKNFWPEIKDAPAASGDGKHEGVAKGNAFDLSFGKFDGFPKQPSYESHSLKAVVTTDDAVMYENDVDPAKATKEDPKRWYVMVALKNQSKKVRTGYIAVFGKGTDDLPPLPSSYNVGGLMDNASDQDLTTSGAQIKLLTNTDRSKGAYVVTTTAAEQPRDAKANCVGPIVWWGMARPDAVKACQKGEL